jgi:hypothetical protein
MLIIISVIGCIIVVILAIVAWRLQRQVNAVEAKKRQQAQEIDTLKKNHQHYLNNSIQMLAQGLIDSQLSFTEGAIRISVLMNNLPINDQHREEFSAFFQLADATSHIPILGAWKKLSKTDKLRFENEREAMEEKYKDFVIDAAKRIQGRKF